MKKIGFLLAALSALISIASCNKKDSGPGNLGGIGKYAVNGVHDLTLYAGKSAEMPLAITYISGVQGAVTVAIDGLPAGVAATPTVSTGVPSFNTNIQFTVSTLIAAGTHPIKIITSSSAMESKTVEMNLIIKKDCLDELTGVYDCTENDPPSFVSNIYPSGTPGQITITNFGNGVSNINANVDCSSGKIVIPSQLHQGSGTTVLGSGSFAGKIVTIDYSINSGSGGQRNYTMRMEKR
jgi:hypothetical protein